MKIIRSLINRIMEGLERRLGIFGPFSFRVVGGLFLAFGSLYLFAELSEDLLFNELLFFDEIVTDLVRHFASNELTTVMKLISQFGSTLFLTVTCLLAVLYFKYICNNNWDAFVIPVVLIGGLLLNQSLKFLFQRQRPMLPHLVAASGFSFPSGHAMISMVYYGILAYLFWIHSKGKIAKYFWTLSAIFLVLFVGISRIYLGVHYPSDVLAGFSAGAFWLIVCVYSLKALKYKYSEI